MKAKIRNGRLIVSVPMQEPTPSKSSGKTLVVASSRGPQESSVLVEGKPVYVNLNAYIYADTRDTTTDPQPKRKRENHQRKLGREKKNK